jgi:hypothetical protein
VGVSRVEARVIVKSSITRKEETWRSVGNRHAFDCLIKFPRLKLYTSPCGKDMPKNGSQFRPWFSVSLGVIFQVSAHRAP